MNTTTPRYAEYVRIEYVRLLNQFSHAIPYCTVYTVHPLGGYTVLYRRRHAFLYSTFTSPSGSALWPLLGGFPALHTDTCAVRLGLCGTRVFRSGAQAVLYKLHGPRDKQADILGNRYTIQYTALVRRSAQCKFDQSNTRDLAHATSGRHRQRVQLRWKGSSLCLANAGL
jgi:hypothetical protein